MEKEFFEKTFKFVPESNIPYYVQLAEYFKIQIQTGAIKNGEKMLTEKELCDVLGISRTTIRLCMNQLIDEGLITRQRGKGSFISQKKVRRNVSYLYSFSSQIQEIGAVPRSDILHSKVMEVGLSIRSILQVPRDQHKVFFLSRLRYVNNDPIMIEHSYIPYYLCEGIEQLEFSNTSLYGVLNSLYSLKLHRAEEVIEAIVIGEEESKLLQCDSVMPGYKIQRISYLNSGSVYEYTTSITRSDKCELHLDLYANTSDKKDFLELKRHILL